MNQRSDNKDLSDIQQLMAQGKFDSAITALNTLLSQDAEHPDANYMAAVCYRYQNAFAQAQQHLARIMDVAPDKGRVYQEQGHLYRAQQQMPQATAAYQTACQINPALLASWKALTEIHAADGQQALAAQAQGQLQRLQSLPKVLVAVSDLIAQGKLFKAEALCKKFLQQNPTHAEAMRLLSDIAQQLGAMEEAEFLLQSAIEFTPDNTQVKMDHIRVLRRRQKFADSLDAAEKLYQSAPDNPQFQSLYAIEKMQVSDYDGAIALFDQVLQQLPGDAITCTSKGHALKTWGKQDEAIASYQSAIANNNSYGEAYYSLSNLKTYRFSDTEVAQMQTQLDSETLSANNRVHLHFALGKACEDQQHWQQAFTHYQQGNRVKKRQSRYDADKMSEEILSQRAFFSSDMLTTLGENTCLDAAPIFIVGLPRAGSTLLEQILSSHSQVDGTLELPNMLSIAQKLRRQGQQSEATAYPELLQSLSAEERQALGQQYIDETRIHRQGAAFFIDKMPNNFRHIGLIKSILPNAKIIDARRHPVACCFSGFKQLFAEGQEFSYSIDDIAQYYNDYLSLMQHWDQVLPGAVLRVQYEDVTADLASQVRRILDYCELPFEENCLNFHKTERAVRTASSEQVRQPIYQSGVDQWRNFETQLAPLIHKLQPALASYRG